MSEAYEESKGEIILSLSIVEYLTAKILAARIPPIRVMNNMSDAKPKEAALSIKLTQKELWVNNA